MLTDTSPFSNVHTARGIVFSISIIKVSCIEVAGIEIIAGLVIGIRIETATMEKLRYCIKQSPMEDQPRQSISTPEKNSRHQKFRNPRQPLGLHASSIFALIVIILVCSVASTASCFVVDALLPTTTAASKTTRRGADAEPIRFQPTCISDTKSQIVDSRRTTIALFAEKKSGRAQGVYVRPSGAIEKGSGFFVPGLEGPKVRLAIGLVLLGATAVNHLLLDDFGSFGSRPKIDSGDVLSFSETTAVAYSVLLLFQSAIEYAKEALPEATGVAAASKSKRPSAALRDAAATEVLDQAWSASTTSESTIYRSGVQWAAASYVSMTPTTQVLLLARDGETSEPGICYRLGGGGEEEPSDEASGVTAALEELSRSKGGRIALPLTHPASQALLVGAAETPPSSDADEESSSDTTTKLRTVILQRITDDRCWMVASDQLLAGYTKGDLKWLGELAKYVAALE
jgi:hypothetical protein